KGATRTALADDGDDDGGLEAGHFVETATDGFGLAALFGSDAWECAWGVDESEQRQAELFRKMHEPQCFAITFGPRHAEITVNLFFGVAPLLMSDEHASHAIEPGQPTDDGGIIGVGAIAVQLVEIGEHP